MEEEIFTRKVVLAARRESLLNAPVIHHPPLITQVPLYEVANAEGEEQIHELAMRIVEELGVEFRESQALEIWGKTDAEISGQNVRVNRRTLLDLVEKAPSEFTHHARNP